MIAPEEKAEMLAMLGRIERSNSHDTDQDATGAFLVKPKDYLDGLQRERRLVQTLQAILNRWVP